MNEVLSVTQQDERWMARALELAKHGLTTTWPNPMVGCVVVKQDTLLGEGWHVGFGQAHAEVAACDNIPKHVSLADATAYVTLEPCSHHGKTPPCADMLVERGVGRVVVAMADPNPLVAGRGLTRLREAGISVSVGCRESEAAALNQAFVHIMTHETPWVTLKWAQSLDGFMDPDVDAPPGRGGRPISGTESGKYVHTLRARHDGIMVGMQTVLVDHPSLTTRLVQGAHPTRIILSNGKTPPPDNWSLPEAWESSQKPTHLLVPKHADVATLKAWTQWGVNVLPLAAAAWSPSWWQELREATGLKAVLVEGGASILRQALGSGHWHEIHRITSKAELTRGLMAPSIPGDKPFESRNLGQDLLEVWSSSR
ncbi:MAG: bifunctional diaminohydroxyphosphoribosylaminopyrimidine deaminase/5-amino-6-(5-phosphoribosylamino)uracil reductase RibD [Bacteroidetes bacterium]|nr:bifunctional diaminohydroxyphosphoribosylaminopyrimidine deaminase/5-amino-6-(5-phosphoribosylamino)uracil reductase RibD [Bacteroidota bacterium]MDA0904211.1 bifunctional diaminohydroxyphosphoribosylaminopyrimidine deaminase/5-amino-6-(5-phosphoribosylamino)uracil reductase RibD [Bacteroidota bacterium]MDA1242961.1 bifunctional diaminohydroxyphosphoribosylaminopyrimidine deaminase/5-amino-6-(5-phosphoribosylamino)uracil reductase RibD [Bacteroidota bacterium]